MYMLKQKSIKRIITTLILIALVAFSLGCTDNEQSNIGEEISDGLESESPVSKEATENRIATIETEKGVIKFELYEKRAPITTANFIELAESGFYDGLTFHRVIHGFMIQGGRRIGAKVANIPDEFHPELKHTTGTVSMANAGPNTGNSQFFITETPQPQLDNMHSVFGQIIEGQEIVQQIAQDDKMLKAVSYT